jgi:hypothetical protein
LYRERVACFEHAKGIIDSLDAGRMYYKKFGFGFFFGLVEEKLSSDAKMAYENEKGFEEKLNIQRRRYGLIE